MTSKLNIRGVLTDAAVPLFCSVLAVHLEAVLKLDESREEEESSLSASVESSKKISGLNYEVIKNDKSHTCFEKSVQNQTVEDSSFQPAVNNTEEN
ncbi:hypothetical protein J6590_101937, partial [Homalodisca vitripennis]